MKADPFELAVRERLAEKLGEQFTTFQNHAYKGNRTGFRHIVDAAFEAKRDGTRLLTLAECKFQPDPVPSELVMAFAFCLEDVGADKGLYVSSTGYALGSYRVANAVGMSLLLCVKRDPSHEFSKAEGNMPIQVFFAGQARKGGEIQFAHMVSDVQCCPIPDLSAFVLGQLGQ